MGKLPFTDYDFWAYLSAGFLFLVAADHAHGSDWMLNHTWTIAEGLFVTACAYIIGHMIAGIAAALIERKITRRWVGRPINILMGETQGLWVLKCIYPSFYEPLPAETRAAVKAKAALAGVHQHGDSLFWLTFGVAKSNARAGERMIAFQNLYGMCRNMSLTLIMGGALICLGAYGAGRPADYFWGLLGMALGIGMFFRYLKFHRHYTLEILTTFAHSS